MLTKERVLKILENNKDEIYTRFNVNEIGIFGSFSQNVQDETSDIDFIVDFDTESIENYTSNKYALKQYLKDLYGRDVDICVRKFIKPFVKDHILENTIYV